MAGSVRVTGLTETLGKLNAYEALVTGELMSSVLKAEAERVAASARGKISRYRGASLSTIKPSRRVTARYAAVYQNKRKVTGNRGDFGALQMTRGLIPALHEGESRIVTSIDHVLGRAAHMTGLG